MPAEIKSVSELLSMELRIPNYQRPYRWTKKNVIDLLEDIDNAISKSDEGFKYRIGSIILHNNQEQGCFDLVDGQQRTLSLILLLLCLDAEAHCPLLDKSTFSDESSKANLSANHQTITDWLSYKPDEWRKEALEAFDHTLEAVVITVNKVEEAFQLFDSQNTRGRDLDPHDLLKAYHLRAMHDRPYEMRHVVTQWEEFSADDVRSIFGTYLFPCLNWERKQKTHPFTAKDIDVFKGISASSGYTYAARAQKAAPCFQIDAPFIEGEDFFLMAEHYLQLKDDIEQGLKDNPELKHFYERLDMKTSQKNSDHPHHGTGEKRSVGYHYASDLFRCALFAYYDRFHNFDERAVKKLFIWAFMIRVDMNVLSFATINKYAIGETPNNNAYTNQIPMFERIAHARSHAEIANLEVKIREESELKNPNEERRKLWGFLVNPNGSDGR